MEETKLEALNEEAYEKLEKEQDEFRSHLMNVIWINELNEDNLDSEGLPFLRSGYSTDSEMYRYLIQADILEAFWGFSEEQCRAILATDKPLAKIFEEYEGFETHHMDYIRDAIRNVIEEIA